MINNNRINNSNTLANKLSWHMLRELKETSNRQLFQSLKVHSVDKYKSQCQQIFFEYDVERQTNNQKHLIDNKSNR